MSATADALRHALDVQLWAVQPEKKQLKLVANFLQASDARRERAAGKGRFNSEVLTLNLMLVHRVDENAAGADVSILAFHLQQAFGDLIRIDVRDDAGKNDRGAGRLA